MDDVSFDFLKKHFVLTSSSDVQAICKPLFEGLQTSYFNFVRRYNDGSEFCLTSDPVWTEYFFTHKLYSNILIESNTLNNRKLLNVPVFKSWLNFAGSKALLEQQKYFGVGIGISLVYVFDDYTDYYHIGTDNKNTHMINRYLENVDLLQRFIYFFQDKASKLFLAAKDRKNRIIIPGRAIRKNITKTLAVGDIDEEGINKFLVKIEPKKYYINVGQRRVHITRKEMKCIKFSTEGKTSPETAELMFIDKRTVEKHFSNVRDRTGCRNKSEIIKLLMDGGINFDLI